MFDLGLATQNLCLAACNRGLGTVIVGLFDHDKAGAVLNLPAGHEVVVMIPLGFPAKQSSAPKRKQRDEFVYTNTF
jgi:nitroreductase